MIGRLEDAKEVGREAIVRAEHVLALNPVDARALSLASLALFDDGQEARAIEMSRRSLELYPDDWIEHDPDYDILRDDPRFKRLLLNLK